MNDDLKGQVSRSAAEIYDELFLPALFAQWAPRIAEAAAISPGQRVLDVACGTGVLAREAQRRITPGGSVVGLDINAGMLAVARRKEPAVDWREGRAESLPFEDGAFDAVVSQFGLMFFEDKPGALREMTRVVKPGGRLAVAVWDALERSEGYAAMAELVEKLFGARMARELRAPFDLGDGDALRALFHKAGVEGAEIASVDGSARYPSLEVWLHVDVKGWTLADLIDDDQFEKLRTSAEEELARFVQPDGSVAFRSPARVATLTKT